MQRRTIAIRRSFRHSPPRSGQRDSSRYQSFSPVLHPPDWGFVHHRRSLVLDPDTVEGVLIDLESLRNDLTSEGGISENRRVVDDGTYQVQMKVTGKEGYLKKSTLVVMDLPGCFL